MGFSDRINQQRKLVAVALDKYIRRVCCEIRKQELMEKFQHTGKYWSVFRQPNMTYR